MVKKWWILALVLTLALSLTSCSSSKKNRGLLSGGGNTIACDGTLGQFDVTVSPTNTADLFILSIIPTQNVTSGDLVQVAIGNSQNIFRTVVNSAVVFPGVEMTAFITQNDLNSFNIVAIQLGINANFTQPQFSENASCQLINPNGQFATSF